jgi:TonB family protein
MSQQTQITSRSRQVACIAIVAGLSLFGASAAHAQWAAKPAPPLPRSVLDQAVSGSVVLGLVFENNGQVRDVRIVRSSGTPALDEIAQRGAMRWRLNPASLQPSDMTVGRQHLIKFFQNAKVSRRVEPFTAFWQEL